MVWLSRVYSNPEGPWVSRVLSAFSGFGFVSRFRLLSLVLGSEHHSGDSKISHGFCHSAMEIMNYDNLRNLDGFMGYSNRCFTLHSILGNPICARMLKERNENESG